MGEITWYSQRWINYNYVCALKLKCYFIIHVLYIIAM